MKTPLHRLALAFVAVLALAAPALSQQAGGAESVIAPPEIQAQGASAVVHAVLALPSTISRGQNRVAGRLYDGVVHALVDDANGNPRDFIGYDRISLTLAPRRGTDGGLAFAGTRAEFDTWVRANKREILAILFPVSFGASASGRETGQFFSQQFLLTTALGKDSPREVGRAGKASPGGLVEYEWFNRTDALPGDSGRAWQGLYGISRNWSVQARFTQQREDFTTNSMTAILDYAATKEHSAFQVMLRVNFISGNGDKGMTRFIGSEGVIDMSGNGFTINHNLLPKAPGIGGYDALDTYPAVMQDELLKAYGQKYTDEDKKRPVKPPVTYKNPDGYDEHFDHFVNFFEGIRSQKPIVEDAAFGFRAAAPCLACNDSYFQKKIVYWDPVAMKLKA